MSTLPGIFHAVSCSALWRCQRIFRDLTLNLVLDSGLLYCVSECEYLLKSHVCNKRNCTWRIETPSRVALATLVLPRI